MADPRPVIITGASRGIGLQLSRQFAAKGYPVIGIARNRPVEDAPFARFIRCDLSDRGATSALAARLAGLRPQGLINNAAIQSECDPRVMPPDRLAAYLQTELDLNLAAPMILGLALLPVIAEAPNGFICNVNSCLALAPKTAAPAYCAAKAGLSNATIALRNMAGTWPDILVAEVMLPLVDTDMTTGRGKGKISAADAAAGILRGIAARQDVIRIGGAKALHAIWRLSPALARIILRGPAKPADTGAKHGALS